MHLSVMTLHDLQEVASGLNDLVRVVQAAEGIAPCVVDLTGPSVVLRMDWSLPGMALTGAEAPRWLSAVSAISEGVEDRIAENVRDAIAAYDAAPTLARISASEKTTAKPAKAKLEPAAKMAPADRAAVPAWTDAEVKRAIAIGAESLLAGRALTSNIAALVSATGRTHDACKKRLQMVRTDAETLAAELKAAKSQAIAAAVASTPQAPASVSAVGLTGRQRDLVAAVRRVGMPTGWDAELDLDVVEGLAKGRRLDDLALDLGVDGAGTKRRYADLTKLIRNDKGQITIDGQSDLLVALRAIVKETRARSA